MKTFKDVLECAVETTQNYNSDVFFSYSGHTNAIGLYAYFNGWTTNSDPIYFGGSSSICLDSKTDKEIDALATEMIEWIETNRIEKD